MRPTTEIRKLAELRAKTDRQLIELVMANLERGHALLESPVDEESYTLAEDAYCEASRLASALYTLPEIEHRRLIVNLENLRRLLDRHSVRLNLRAEAAC